MNLFVIIIKSIGIGIFIALSIWTYIFCILFVSIFIGEKIYKFLDR